MDHVQTKSEIRSLLDAAGTRPCRRFGQNFLIDGNLMRALVASADLGAEDVILEVGGGTGSLTALLVGSAAHVVCVEIDAKLQAGLKSQFQHDAQFTLLCTDALASKNRLAPEMVAAVVRAAGSIEPGAQPSPADSTVRQGRRAMLVANLPYQIATPLIGNILLELPQIRRLCFTVQAEVGDRISAEPGSRSYGPISVLMQATCVVRRVARIPPEAFWPRPKVDSVMLRLDLKESPFMSIDKLRLFVSFVRSLFTHRRKTVRSALRRRFSIEVPEAALALDLSLRVSMLGVEDWIGLFDRIVMDDLDGAAGAHPWSVGGSTAS